MNKFILLCVCLLTMNLMTAQVGIATNDPKALLDIRTPNQATPTNKDGILIPKVDDFPATNPTVDQDGLMVFVTGLGTPSKGFYYWDNTTNIWTPINGPLGSSGLNLASNGLHVNASDSSVRLGGSLIENTTVTQGDFNMTHDLNATGDFKVETTADSNLLHVDAGLSRVGIGTATPQQKLEVAGTVRIRPEAHYGAFLNRLVTIDGSGDLRANSGGSLERRNAVSYDLSGQAIQPGNPAVMVLPGPADGYAVMSTFTFFDACNASAVPITITFKRYGTSAVFAFWASYANLNNTQTNLATGTLNYDAGCGWRTITHNLSLTNHVLTFSSGGGPGVYLHSGRTTFQRWQ
jgi:hypothetical protein